MSANWKNRVQNYSEVPPQGTWENIAQILDADTKATKSWIERVNNYEEDAPAFVWQNIENALDKPETKIVSINKNRNIYKFAAAAVFASLLATGIWMYTQSNNTDDNTNNIAEVNSSKTNNVKPPQKTDIAENTTSSNASETQESKLPTAQVVIEKKELKKVQQKTKDIEIDNSDVALAKDPFENDNQKITPSNGQLNNNPDLMNVPNTYVTVAGPNGQLVKVSSKFSKLLGLVNDGKADKEKLDVIIDQSKFWSTKFKQWRDKMLHNNITTSPDNFMDIIELMKVVEEK